MIANLIDRRKRPYRWKRVTAIIELTAHDNIVDDADQAADPGPEAVDYDHRAAISVTDAITWASSLPFAVTLYLYDLGSGI
jgi:hypothetical protein